MLVIDIDLAGRHFESYAGFRDFERRSAAAAAAAVIADPAPTAAPSEAAAKRRRLTYKEPIITEGSCEEFIVGLVDKALQVSLHGLSSVPSAGFAASVGAFVKDASDTLAELEVAMPVLKGVSSPSFYEVLRAIVVVCRCSSRGAGGETPPPSEVRSAREVLNAAKDAKGAFKIAGAMQVHPGARKLMDAAWKQASEGLQDEAASNQFEAMADALDAAMATAMDQGIVAFASISDDGAPHTFLTYVRYWEVAHNAAVELNMVLSAWSTVRLEEKLQDVCFILQNILLICQVGFCVSIKSIERMVSAIFEQKGGGEDGQGGPDGANTTVAPTKSEPGVEDDQEEVASAPARPAPSHDNVGVVDKRFTDSRSFATL